MASRHCSRNSRGVRFPAVKSGTACEKESRSGLCQIFTLCPVECDSSNELEASLPGGVLIGAGHRTVGIEGLNLIEPIRGCQLTARGLVTTVVNRANWC